tara:strand:+ start:5106 stop:5825 length:720 start_codon:yes stop_codon:yes gene_type:complete
MKFLNKLAIIIFILLQVQTLFAEEKLIYGSDIRQIADEYLAENAVFSTILVSDKRAYFPCASKIYVSQQNASDWNTIKASCGNPPSWSVSFRTQETQSARSEKSGETSSNSIELVFTKKNIPKGKVIQTDDLVMKWASSRSSHGAYLTIENIVGLKAKRNMARDTVIKARHVLANNAVNETDTILIVSGSSGISIVTYGEALSNGKLGDMVLVRNLSSNKEFKAIVIAEKKVTPITNIN